MTTLRASSGTRTVPSLRRFSPTAGRSATTRLPSFASKGPMMSALPTLDASSRSGDLWPAATMTSREARAVRALPPWRLKHADGRGPFEQDAERRGLRLEHQVGPRLLDSRREHRRRRRRPEP